MENQPKRRKSKDNPYTINYCSKTNKYTVSFEDGQGKKHYIDITQAIYHALNLFELKDISQMHEYERHIEHSKLTEITLNKRVKDKTLDVDEQVIKNIDKKKLQKEIAKLPYTQKKRLKMYYFDEMTLEEIATKECCSVHSVFVAIERAKEKIKKFIN